MLGHCGFSKKKKTRIGLSVTRKWLPLTQQKTFGLYITSSCHLQNLQLNVNTQSSRFVSYLYLIIQQKENNQKSSCYIPNNLYFTNLKGPRSVFNLCGAVGRVKHCWLSGDDYSGPYCTYFVNKHHFQYLMIHDN